MTNNELTQAVLLALTRQNVVKSQAGMDFLMGNFISISNGIIVNINSIIGEYIPITPNASLNLNSAISN